MPKLSVRDVMNTAHTLQRYQNYADRWMEKVAVSSASDSIKQAQDLMRSANQEFLQSDVSDLTVATSDMEKRLEWYTRERNDVKQEIKTLKKQIKNPVQSAQNDSWWDLDSAQDELKYCKERKNELKQEIADLKADLA